MKNIVRKNIELGVLFGLICAIVLSFARFDANCNELRQGVLRLHIVANSNSATDQELKLAVRDEILKNSTDIFKNCSTVDDAVITASANLDRINKIANDVIEQNGFDYGASVSVGDKYFDTRHYDSFTLPAGIYKSLVIDLGEASGKNWWCVVFPCVCVGAATDVRLEDAVSSEAANTAENATEYEIKFKTAEIYEKIKRLFSKN